MKAWHSSVEQNTELRIKVQIINWIMLVVPWNPCFMKPDLCFFSKPGAFMQIVIKNAALPILLADNWNLKQS